MKLLTLKLKNFKGIKSFELDTSGDNTSIYGDNATGKTTLFDAFLWLLFDKDSQNKTTFDIKTLDKNNVPIHGLDHEVEATLSVGNKPITLRKTYREKWTKKRGSATAEFTGHTTDHFINDVPVKKSEYDAQIDQIATEDIFRLLTSPTFFNEHLHWTDRRKLLLEVAGDISDADVIASDKSLAKLPEILGDHTMEELRKVIATRRSKINKELDRIPVRVDEVELGLPDISDIDPEELNLKIKTLKSRIAEKEKQIVRIEGGSEAAEKTKALREIEAQLLEIKNKHLEQYNNQKATKQSELNKIKLRIEESKNTIERLETKLKDNENSRKKLEDMMESLRAEWGRVNDEVFSFEQEDICPTCKRPYPPEHVEQLREKALGEFNSSKAERLAGITEKGIDLKERQYEMLMESEGVQQNINILRTEQLDGLEREYAEIGADIEALTSDMKQYENMSKYKEIMSEKARLEVFIETLKSDSQSQTVGIRAEVKSLHTEISGIEERLADIKHSEQGQKRIKELQDRERKLAAEYEKLEGDLYLTEQFVRTKVQLLEEKINARFAHARFKLFNVLVNGALEECCETVYRGVPYSSGLNNAARINVGLDTINTLSEHYGFSAPIFVDNAEAVVDLIPAKGQVIRLVVSEKDKQLRVETEKTKIKEAV